MRCDPAVPTFRWGTFFMWLALCGLGAMTLGGCSVGYYMQAIGGQLKVLNRRQAIDALIENPATQADLKERLKLVQEIRDFASDRLHLPDNGSYRYYADLQRPYAVWNVFAAPEFSVEPVNSCFLVIGCVSYRGYFREQKARRFAAHMSKKGNDVYVAGIAAYSTLGRFDDPVFNTMIYWEDSQLAGVIFHELAHQRLYVKNDSEFSEAFATVVEAFGVVEWLKSKSDEQALADYGTARAMQTTFARINAQTRQKLRELYLLDIGEEKIRREKKRIFAELKEEYHRIELEQPEFGVYVAYFDRDLNNAHLVSVSTYFELLPSLQCVLRVQANNNLENFFDLAAKLATAPDKESRRQRLDSGAACHG